jgi:hypothetical protein
VQPNHIATNRTATRRKAKEAIAKEKREREAKQREEAGASSSLFVVVRRDEDSHFSFVVYRRSFISGA